MRRFILRFWHLFRRDAAEQSLSREIATHLTMLEEEFRRRGMTATDARRAARLALGGIERVKDAQRDARSFVWIEDARRDVVHAARLIRRNPVFALTAVLSLAIGIGANSAIFTVANALLFRDPVGVAEPARLVDIGTARGDGGLNPTSYPNYLDVARRATRLGGVYAQHLFPHAVSLDTRGDADVRRVYGHFVSTTYFSVLGATPALGRFFDAADDPQAGAQTSAHSGASPVVVLSHRLWTNSFDRDPAIVGRTIRINGQPLTVIGVAQDRFQGTGLLASDLWLPLNMTAANDTPASTLMDRSDATVMIGARVKPGISIAQASSEIAAIGLALGQEYPDTTVARRGLRLVVSSRAPGNARLLGGFVVFLTIIVSLILIVACANVASILLARATARRREVAVRLAIGAGRARLVRQLLTETSLLFAIGGAAGLIVARAAIRLLVPLLPSLPFPVSVTLAVDGRVIAFTAAISLVTALCTGLAPALQSSRLDVVASLNADSQGPSGRSTVRNAVVIAQVACSLLLVIIAGLFVHALQRAGSMDPGFQASSVEIVTIDPSMGHYSAATGPRFLRELVDRLRAVPGMQEATIAKVVPGGFEGLRLSGLTAAGFEPAGGQRFLYPSWNVVEPGYFATLQIPLVAGRDFNATDLAGTQPVMILSEGLARRFWPGEPLAGRAVGKYVSLESKTPRPPLLVVGIAGDIKTSSLVDGLAEPFVYVPLQQQYASGWTSVTIAARGARGRSVSAEIHNILRSMDPNLPIVAAQTLADSTALGLVTQRIVASVSGALGTLGMLLAAIGIYGVTAYTVARRGREIGIRVALGARRRHVAAMVVAHAMWLAAIGSAVGLALAALISRALTGYLFGVPALDPATFVGSVLLFATIVAAASYVPARRATRADPLSALRRE